MIFLVLIPLILFGAALIYLYQNRDGFVKTEIDAINQEYQGEISIGATHLAPFANFPYISIQVDSVKIKESKQADSESVLEVGELYIGLDITDILQGKLEIKKLRVENGFFDIVLYEDGSNNLSKALASNEEEDTSESETMDLKLESIELKNFDIHKKDKSTGLDVQTQIFWADGGFESVDDRLAAHIDTEFELNIIKNGDTTYVKHKEFEFHTDIGLDEKTGIMSIAPSVIDMTYAEFEISGTVDTRNNMDLDIEIIGQKANFDLFMAFAPNELVPILDRYKNAGKIYFNAKLQGPAAFGYDPFIDVHFGASEAFLENTDYGRRVDNMGFEGHFTNGAERNPTTMEFAMENMTAKLEEGDFVGSVRVKNFESPEIDMNLDAEFDLNFIAEFLNLKDYKDASGTIDLKMKFHDIVDLDHPEKALEDLNQAYYSELTLKNLKLNSLDLPAPLKSLNAHLVMQGERAELDQFELNFGESDLSITGYLSDLPAIIHQTPTPVKAHLDIQSKLLDLAEITGNTKSDSLGINERIEDLTLGLSFAAKAQDLAKFNYLPKGEFFVDSLNAKLQNYPHELHDFHVDILIDEKDLRIVDFTGFVDESDFELSGKVHDYAFWMKDSLVGDVKLDLGLESDKLQLEDLLSYQGENYVPEEYRHEEFDQLKLHFNSLIHYEPYGLQSIQVDLDLFDARMHLHPMRFKDVSGKFLYENENISIRDFHAELGRSIFNIDLDYQLGDSIQKENYLRLKTNYIDFDQLTNFNPEAPPKTEPAKNVYANASAKEDAYAKATASKEDVSEHADAYNLYELPFSDMAFDLEIDHFIYHRLDVKDIRTRLRTTADHYLYVDTLSMKAAGGNISMNGYFNGSDPERIYLKPRLKVDDVDLDQLLFKFENFGQDAIVSENLHGQLTATITGHIRVYPDFVPDLDQSEVHMDVMALNGRLENYDYLLLLSDYFGDKNLRSVRFDTLQNHIDVVNGVLTIPNMTIESTLGHMQISGTQDMDNNIDYYVRIPWRLIKQGAVNRVFGSKKRDENDPREDEIIEVDPNENVRYLNLRITGTLEDYKIRPGKEKKDSG